MEVVYLGFLENSIVHNSFSHAIRNALEGSWHRGWVLVCEDWYKDKRRLQDRGKEVLVIKRRRNATLNFGLDGRNAQQWCNKIGWAFVSEVLPCVYTESEVFLSNWSPLLTLIRLSCLKFWTIQFLVEYFFHRGVSCCTYWYLWSQGFKWKEKGFKLINLRCWFVFSTSQKKMLFSV